MIRSLGFEINVLIKGQPNTAVSPAQDEKMADKICSFCTQPEPSMLNYHIILFSLFLESCTQLPHTATGFNLHMIHTVTYFYNYIHVFIFL
jgi:hypothetical protein